MHTTTAYPTNATFLAHTAHADRSRRATWCRLCAVVGATRVTWATFTEVYPLWSASRAVQMQADLAAQAPADEDETLGACGCTDYHMADCSTRTGGTGYTLADLDEMDPQGDRW